MKPSCTRLFKIIPTSFHMFSVCSIMQLSNNCVIHLWSQSIHQIRKTYRSAENCVKTELLYVSDYLQLLPHKNRRQLQAVCLRDVGGDQVKNACDIGHMWLHEQLVWLRLEEMRSSLDCCIAQHIFTLLQFIPKIQLHSCSGRRW